MNEDLFNMVSLLLFLVLIIIIIKALKYAKTEKILEATYESDGFTFKISSTYYRHFHFSKKRRHVFDTIISGDKALPNIFLDSHYRDRYLYATAYDTYDQSQRVSLEGDFDKFFQLYAPSGLENEALSFVTPDVMLIFRDKLKKTDMEMISTQIILTTNEKINPKEMQDGICLFLDKVARIYKFTSVDEQIGYQKKLLVRNSIDEAIKIHSRLISVKVFVYLFMTVLPGLAYCIFFLIRDGEVQLVGFILGLLVTMSFGLLAAFLLHASESGWITLDRTKR